MIVQERARPAAPAVENRVYQPYGAARDVLYCRDPEVLLSGPAGTGKSRACLEKLFIIAEKYAGCRILIVRKTRESLTEAALVTWEEKVVPPGHPCLVGPQRRNRQSYKFPNGSVVNVGGMDKPGKIMSTEYDIIYVQEAIELTETDWESLTTRLRNGVVPYQQIIADTNPDAPTHWLKQREVRGTLKILESRHEDNPVYWCIARNCATDIGEKYLSKLDNLTGVRKARLRHGQWVAAEGLVYDLWDPHVHMITADVLPVGWRSWPRFWVVDFGFTHPFVWQEWLFDPDGRLYLLREIYRSKRLVEDHAAEILRVCGWEMVKDRDTGQPIGKRAIRENPDPLPKALVCDHDAEDRATLERHLGIETIGAYKAVSAGIQAVAGRMKAVPEGQPNAKPRIYIVRDGLVDRDPDRSDKRLPCSTSEEILEYVWDTAAGRKRGEEPVKLHDHGMDAMRYIVAHVDAIRVGVTEDHWDVY